MKQHPNIFTASTLSKGDEQAFQDLHELAEILEALGQHLHAKNRIALGESGYYWHLAETLQKLGRLATLPMEFPAVDEDFGHAYPPETLAHDEQERRFLALLGSQSNDALLE